MDITYSWDERNDHKLPYIELTLTVKVGGEKFAAQRRISRMELEYATAPGRIKEYAKRGMMHNVSYTIAEHIMDVVKA